MNIIVGDNNHTNFSCYHLTSSIESFRTIFSNKLRIEYENLFWGAGREDGKSMTRFFFFFICQQILSQPVNVITDGVRQ